MNLFKCETRLKDGQFKGSKEFYEHEGVEQGTQFWNFDLGKLVKVKSASIQQSWSSYALQARATTSDNWVTLTSWEKNSGGLKEIINNNRFRYFLIICYGASGADWEEGAGLWWKAYARNLIINYKYKEK